MRKMVFVRPPTHPKKRKKERVLKVTERKLSGAKKREEKKKRKRTLKLFGQNRTPHPFPNKGCKSSRDKSRNICKFNQQGYCWHDDDGANYCFAHEKPCRNDMVPRQHSLPQKGQKERRQRRNSTRFTLER